MLSGVYFVFGVRMFSNFILIFMVEGILTVSSGVGVPHLYPKLRGGGFPCLHTLSALIVCRVFGNGHSSWCDVIPRSLELHFSNV